MPLPLPIEALLRRARNAKAAKERHDVAYFAWEASVRIGVAAKPPADVTGLAVPSVGDWVAAFQVPDRKLDAPEVLAAYRLFADVGHGRRPSPKSVSLRKLFDGLPAYRNAAVGHGAVRPPEFYDPASHTLVAALAVLWEESVFWPSGSKLAHIESIEVDKAGVRRARLFDLMGPAATVVDPRGVTGLPNDVLPHRLYMSGADGTHRSLHPWLLFHEAELQERVLFFNARRRSARYLDYVGGEELRGAALVAAFPTIDGELDVLLEGAVVDSGEPSGVSPAVEGPAIAGYEILGKLGEGGMGVVYLARQRILDRLVALKTLPRHLGDDVTAVARFRREIQALGRCEHPNVIKIVASGVSDGAHYYAMEFIAGADLAAVAKVMSGTGDLDGAISSASEPHRSMRARVVEAMPEVPPEDPAEMVTRSGKDRLRRLAELFRDAARGVQHLHEQGILHRDIKPGNLMVTEGEHRVVLMDLGLAAVGDASQSITRDQHQILGTLRYMPPEQLQRNMLQLDRRADVYALGATFYELLAGQPLFDGDNEARLIEQVLREEPMSPSRANSEIDQDLALIVEKATRKDTKLRYETAEALANDLDAYLQGRPIAARPPSVGYVLRLAVARHKPTAMALVALVVVVTASIGYRFVEKERMLEREHELRVDAERQRQVAQEERQRATNERDRARQTMIRLLEESGRTELLLLDHPSRALVFLAEAYRQDPEDIALRGLIADAVRPLDALARTLDAHDGAVLSIAAVGNGSRFVTGGRDGKVRVWEAETCREIEMLSAFDGAVYAVAVDPRGGRVLAASDDQAVVWTVETDTRVPLVGHEKMVWSAAFAPDGGRLVTGAGDQTLRLWEAESGELLRSVRAHESTVYAVAFAPDGDLVATGGRKGVVKLWSARRLSSIHTLRGHTKSVFAVAFSPDGKRLASGSGDNSVRLWNVDTGEQTDHYEGHTNAVFSVAFNPSGDRFATGSRDNTARIWDVTSARALLTLGHAGNVLGVAFIGDGATVVTGSTDGRIRQWKPATAKLQRSIGDVEFSISALAISPDGSRVVAAGGAKSALVWDVEAGEAVGMLKGHRGSMTSVAYSRDGSHIITGSTDNSAIVWDAGSLALQHRLEKHAKDVKAVAVSEDGERFATGGADAVAFVWEKNAGALEPIGRLAGHRDSITSVAFSPDGAHLATGSLDRTARVWDLAERKQTGKLEGHEAGVWSVTYSLDGTKIATASMDKTARVWAAQSGAELTSVASRDDVWSVAFSPDGALLATGSSDRSAKVWEVESGKLIASLAGHRELVSAVVFHPHEPRLFTASADTTIKVWDVGLEARSPSELATLVEERLPWKLNDGQVVTK